MSDSVTKRYGTGPNGERVSIEVVNQPPLRLPSGAPAKRRVGIEKNSPFYNPISPDVLKRPYDSDKAVPLIKAIRDLDPMVSQAVWNYLRLLNPGHTLRVYLFDGTGQEVEEKGPAQDFIDGLVRRVGAEYGGGLDQLHNVLGLMLLTAGAVALEVAPNPALNDVIDWYPIDPNLLAYKRDQEGNLILGQVFQDGTFEPVNQEQVFYQPLDPDVNLPYGRMPLLGAIQSVLAKHSLLADIRAVAHNQGFPRIDVSVLWEAIDKAAPPHLKAPGNEQQYAEWAHSQLNSVVEEYEKLAIDDTFVHFDWIELNMVGSTTPGGTSFNFKELDRILTEQLNAALKSLPILNGTLDSDEHGHGSIQWQIQVAGIAALQRMPKRVIEKCANVSLALAGLPGHAKLEYDPIRSVDRLYEAQSNLFETKSLQIEVFMGWRSNDEAALIRTGHTAFSDPLPENPPQTNADINANNSGDKAPGAGGDAPTTPKDAEEGKSGQEMAAWHLLNEPVRQFDTTQQTSSPGGHLQEISTSSQSHPDATLGSTTARQLSLEELEEEIQAFERQATIIFYSAMDVLIAELRDEGFELRDVPKDVSDYVFGLRYSREMKALLRQAISRGMTAAGATDTTPDERLVERIWKENRQYVLKIRDDLKAALRAGEFSTVDDIRRWFDRNAIREQLMGRYLAKQGITGGYAGTISEQRGEETPFIWRLGLAEHCESCSSRSGQRYTYSELLSIGLPGSSALQCGANCRCSLEEVE